MDVTPANPELQPFVEVTFVLEQPEPDLKHRVELALADKPVRLARIQTRTTSSNQSNSGISTLHDMEQLTPEQVFQSLYARKYKDPMSDELKNAFAQIANQALHAETAQ